VELDDFNGVNGVVEQVGSNKNNLDRPT